MKTSGLGGVEAIVGGRDGCVEAVRGPLQPDQDVLVLLPNCNETEGQIARGREPTET